VLDDIGLFDEDFYFNNEDVDLNFRHQLAGYRCRFVPEAIVYHHGSATGGVASDFTVYHIHRNKEWVFFKNMPSPLLWRYLFQHLIYAVGWTLYWMMHGKARVILKAKFDAFRGTRSIVTKRRLIQRSSKSDWRVIDGLLDKRSVIDFQKSETLRAIFRLGPARPETGKTSERITGA
jgi:GT2 family glycosyltransferase